MFVKSRNRRASSLALFLIFLIAALSTFGQEHRNSSEKSGDSNTETNNELGVEKWREDLQFIATELPKKHKNLFHRLDRDIFRNAIKELDAKIPSLTKNQIALEFSRIVGLAKDGHTSLRPAFDPKMNFQFFPLSLYLFQEGLYIRKASPEYKNIVGAKVLRIGKMSSEEAYKRVSPYAAGGNEMFAMDLAPIFLASSEILHALGISDELGKVSIQTEKDGKTLTTEIKLSVGKDSSVRAVLGAIGSWVDARDGSTNPTPLTMKKMGETFWYEYVEDRKVLYVQLNGVVNGKQKTLAQFFEEVFDFAKKNDPDKFVLDVRFNGGGNDGLIKPIIRGLIKLDKIDQRGHLFVITGRKTFSAAQTLVNRLESWTNAVFVGEPTGANVNHYGDARRFSLPNSGLGIRISELWHQDMNERDTRKWTAPNLAAGPNFDAYKNNIDPAMQAIYNYKLEKTLREIGMEAYRAGDLKSFRQKVIDFKDKPINKYQGVESQVNGFGYELVGSAEIDKAIEMFQLNVELYPNSANAYDSLAEAYMNKGNKELAIRFYKKSLELNPDNGNAKQQIETMQNEKK